MISPDRYWETRISSVLDFLTRSRLIGTNLPTELIPDVRQTENDYGEDELKNILVAEYVHSLQRPSSHRKDDDCREPAGRFDAVHVRIGSIQQAVRDSVAISLPLEDVGYRVGYSRLPRMTSVPAER